MAEKKRSCKSTATLPTLTPATPCCPSFPPLPPPPASQHHFAWRASQGCSLHHKFLLFHLRFYQWNLPGHVFNLFVFPPCVKLVLPSQASLWASKGNHHNKGSWAHSFVLQGQLWQKFDTRLSIFTKLWLFKTTGYYPRSTLLASSLQLTDGAGQKPQTSIA